MPRKKAEQKKKVKMGERCYQGVQWDKMLVPGQEYELPAEFADWLVAGSFAVEVKEAKPKEAKEKD